MTLPRKRTFFSLVHLPLPPPPSLARPSCSCCKNNTYISNDFFCAFLSSNRSTCSSFPGGPARSRLPPSSPASECVHPRPRPPAFVTGGAEKDPFCGLCEWASVEITASFFNTSTYSRYTFFDSLVFFAWTGEFINKQTRCLMSPVRRLKNGGTIPPQKVMAKNILRLAAELVVRLKAVR